MKIRILLILMFFLMLVNACENENNSEFTDTPVIEGYLKPGEFMKLTVRRQIPFSSDVIYSDDNPDALEIRVVHNNITYVLTPLGNGNYVDSSLVIDNDSRYDLNFTFNSKNVSAYTEIPLQPVNFKQSTDYIEVMGMGGVSGPPSFPPGGSMPEPVTLTWDNTDESYYIVVIENMESDPDPIRDFGDDPPPGNIFRKPPTTSSGLQLRPQEFQYFGKHRLILFHVQPDYASLYSDKSTSSQNLTNPSTSIMNGYGIFTGLNSDTLFLDVVEM